MSFRHSAGFGKRIEFWVIGQMLREGLDVYVPLVDDRGVDAVIRRPDGTFAEAQIKARSNDAKEGWGAFFAAIRHKHRANYWFVFYSERMQVTWIMSSKEFLAKANQNKTGKNKGTRSIKFNGQKKDRVTGRCAEYVLPQFQRYVQKDFQRLLSRG